MTLHPRDLLTLPLPDSPTLAADGRVVLAVHTPSADGRSVTSRLQSHRGDDRVPFADGGDGARPVSSPDGRLIAFLSTRAGGRRVHVVDAAGAPVVVLDPSPAAGFTWLDDATLVVQVELAEPADETGTRIDWLRYKSDGRRAWEPASTGFWLAPIDGAARELATAPGAVTSWTTTGRRLHYALETPHADEELPRVALRAHDLDDGTDEQWWEHRAPMLAQATTDRSGHLVVVASADPHDSSAPPVPWLVTADGARHLLADPEVDCDRSVTADARTSGPVTRVRPVEGTDELLVLDTTGTDVALWLVDVTTRTRRRLTPEGVSVTDFSAARGRTVAVCLESPARPSELHLMSLDDAALRRLDGPTTAWRAGRTFIGPETLDAASTDGLPVPSQLYRSGPGVRPLVVRLHGGPHLSYGTAFDLETQLLVAAGYSVLAPSMRGSSGRGRAVRSASIGEWGGRDVDDVLAAVDAALEAGAADPDRLYLAGGSYGGVLINTILTRTDRFRAAVSERGISNWLSKFGTSDNGFTHNRLEFRGADVLTDAGTLWNRSPLSAVDRITTPLLLIHGEDDHRVPIEQSEQLFVALRRLGRECVFLRVPGESHALPTTGRHDRRMRRLGELVGWFDTH